MTNPDALSTFRDIKKTMILVFLLENKKMTTVKYVVLCGNEGAGKDTMADYLVDKYGFTKLAFADQVRNLTSAIYGFKMDDFSHERKDSYVHPIWKLTPRDAMKKVATMIRTNVSDDYFVQAVDNAIKSSQSKKVVISDYRFDIETKYLSDKDKRVIRIKNDKVDKEKTYVDLLKCDYIINNSGTKEDFHKCIDTIFAKSW